MTETYWKSLIGPVVREARLAREIAQKDLADAAGLHPAVIVRLERGGRIASLPTLERVATALGLKASELVAMVEAAPRPRRKPSPKKAAKKAAPKTAAKKAKKASPKASHDTGKKGARGKVMAAGPSKSKARKK